MPLGGENNMPNIKSAIKRVDVTQKRTIRNARIKSALRTTIKRFEEAMKASNQEEAGLKLRNVVVAIDKAVTKGILHKNAASRKKSRLTKRYNKMAG
jgi:small subunit ribosomal protein S20